MRDRFRGHWAHMFKNKCQEAAQRDDRDGPEGEWFGGRHGGFRRHHMRGGRGRGMLDGAELRLILLKLIADQPRHGYELIQAVGELTGGSYAPSPGIVYPALSMLEDMGQIAPMAGDSTRKAFAISEAGSAELAAQAETVAGLFKRLEGLAAQRGQIDAAPVRRAVQNLRSVLHATLGREGVAKDQVHQVAAILDAAAQQIERLS